MEKVTGGKALPPEVVQQIVSKTDGVPLFVEELTKMVVESVESIEVEGRLWPSRPYHWAFPPLCRIRSWPGWIGSGPAKEIAQLGATIGREFTYELLQAVSPLNEDTLQQGLTAVSGGRAALSEWACRRRRAYLFKHALMQDTAYQSLLKSRRQQLHQQVAQVLAEQFPQTVETQPELVAHHYTEAGLIAQAIPYWQQAGELASKRLALKEAIAHLNQGMEILGTLPPSPERDGQELDLRTRLGTAWMALKGWAAPEVWTSLHPALGLAKSLGRHEALLPIYWGLWEHVVVQGRVAESLDWVNEMLATAEASGDPDLLIVAHWAACTTHFWRGDLTQSRAHGDRVLALYDEEQHRHLADLMNIDPKTAVGIHGSLGTWMLGYPDRAVQLSEAKRCPRTPARSSLRPRLGAHYGQPGLGFPLRTRRKCWRAPKKPSGWAARTVCPLSRTCWRRSDEGHCVAAGRAPRRGHPAAAGCNGNVERAWRRDLDAVLSSGPGRRPGVEW